MNGTLMIFYVIFFKQKCPKSASNVKIFKFFFVMQDSKLNIFGL